MNTTTNDALASPVDKSEASGEWASSTLSALGPVASKPYPADKPTESQNFIKGTEDISHTGAYAFEPPSTATTPGVQVPGAFPSTKPFGDEHNAISAKETTTHALEAAKGYAYSAGESARGYAYGASETMSGFLPARMAAYLPVSASHSQHAAAETSLPSSETTQNHTPSSSAGVGTLPGPPGEIGVAQLPEERIQENSFPSSGLNTSTAATPNDQNVFDAIDPAIRKNSLVHPETETEGLAKLPEERRQEVLPSHDDESNAPLGANTGVGALPGQKSETGVAQLPGERDGASLDASTRSLAGSRAPADHELSSSYTQSPGPLPKSPMQPGESQARQEVQRTPIHNEQPLTTAREHPLAEDESNQLGRGSRAVDSMLATPGHDAPGAAGPSSYAPAVPEKDATTVDKTAKAGVDAQDEKPAPPLKKKTGFMDKVRGEMKILSGKLEHSEEKIAEGRRMMGESPSSGGLTGRGHTA